MRLLPLFFLALTGCRNACQQMCVDLAQYAEECGQTPSAEEVDACIDARKTSLIGREKVDQCQEIQDPQKLREWWSCEDLAENWTNLK